MGIESNSTRFLWKTSLKAMISVNLFTILFATIFTAFFPEGAAGIFETFRQNRAGLEDLQTALYFYTGFTVLAWACFGWFYHKIPTKFAYSKIFLFSFLLTIVDHSFKSLFPVYQSLESSFMAENNSQIALLGIFLIITTIQYLFFQYYKRQDEKSHILTNVTLNYAKITDRLIAHIIDIVILFIITIIVVIGLLSLFFAGFFKFSSNPFATGIYLFTLINLIIGVAYYTFLEGTKGKTIGKHFMKLSVVKTDGSKISFLDAFFRNAGKFLSGFDLFLWIDLFFLLWNKKQRISDKMANTIVVKIA